MLIFISILQTLNALLVGGVAGYFAYHQRRIAQAKLRLDLFDKRFAVFNAARTFLGAAMALNKVKLADEEAFMIGTLGASFLLNDELGSYLEEVQRRVGRLSLVQSALEDAQTDEAREEAKTTFLAERNWLLEQANVLAAKFRPYLQLDG